MSVCGVGMSGTATPRADRRSARAATMGAGEVQDAKDILSSAPHVDTSGWDSRKVGQCGAYAVAQGDGISSPFIVDTCRIGALYIVKKGSRTMKKKSEQYCNNCYYHAMNLPWMECHRHTPVTTKRPMSRKYFWPTISRYDWCGMWRDEEDVS